MLCVLPSVCRQLGVEHIFIQILHYFTCVLIYTGPEHIDYSSYSIHNTNRHNNLNRNSSSSGSSSSGSGSTGTEVPEPEKSMRFSTWGARSLEHAGIYNILCIYKCCYHIVFCIYMYMA